MLLVKNEIKIGKKPASFITEGVENYYVQRVLQRKVTFRREALKNDANFVITKSNNFGEEQLTPHSDIIITFDSEENFKTLCCKFNKRNIHWMKETNGELQWQKSHGSLRKLRNIVTYFMQDFEVDYIEPSPVELLVAEPGMGKSTIFSFMANKMKQKNPTSWVSNVCLHDHSGVFSEWPVEKRIDDRQIIGFLFDTLKNAQPSISNQKGNNLVGPALLEREIFYHLYEAKQIIIFLDGYDEISPNYEKQVLTLVNMLKEKKIKSLWISTRPNLQTKLEEDLNVFSLKLKPFETEDQKKFLKTYWKVNIKNELSDKRLVEFCSRILSQFSHTIGDQPSQFCGIPLQLRMIAAIFTKRCEECCNSCCFETVENMMGNNETTMALIDLYDEFFRIKFEVVQYQEKNRMDLESIYVKQIVKDQAPGVLQTHRILAVFTLLHEEMREKFLSTDEILQGNKLLETVSDSREKTGIVYRIVNGKPIFVHQTFAEYFFINYFWQKLITCEFDLEAIVYYLICNNAVQVWRFLLQKVHKEQTVRKNPMKPKSLIRFCKIVVQNFIWYYKRLASFEEYYPPICSSDMAVILEVVDSCIFSVKEQNCSAVLPDLLLEQREFLFCVSITNNSINLVKCLEDAFKPWNINATYRYHDFMDGSGTGDRLTALHVAVRNGHTELVEHLIEVGADVNVASEMLCTPLHMAVKLYRGAVHHKHVKIIELLVKNGAIVDNADSNRETALMLSLKNKLYEAANYLIILSNNINSTDSGGLTALHWAAKVGHAETIEKLVAADAKVDATTKNGDTALMVASKFGHSDAVDALLERYNNINATNSEGWTALHYAAVKGKIEIIEKLLKAGAKVHVTTKNGDTALMVASKFGHSDAVDALLERYNNINATNSEGWTALHCAAVKGKIEIIEKLLKAGAKVHVTTKNGDTALMVASKFGHSDAVDALLERYNNINATNSEGWTALHCAAVKGKIEIIEKLLKAGAKVHVTTKNGDTALMVASKFGHSDAVDALLERYNNINATNSEGWTALHCAAVKGKIEIIEKLLKAGAKVHVTTKNGDTALMVASKFGHSDAVDALLERYNNINATNSEGWTALHYAAVKGKIEIIEKLLKAGAKVHVTTKNGNAAVLTASEFLYRKVADVTLERVRSIYATNFTKWTALHCAAKGGEVEIIKTLLTAGAYVDATTEIGNTALMIASDFGHSDAVAALLERDKKIDAANLTKWTALHYAAREGNVNIIEKLLAAGAKVDVTTENGDTALMVASGFGRFNAVVTLLKRDKNINAANSKGWTALHYAAKGGNVETINKLLEAEANVYVTTANGDTALMVAAGFGRCDAVVSLLKRAKNINAANLTKWTALHYAAREGNVNIIEKLRSEAVIALLERGKNINAANSNGWTALHYAAQEGNGNIIEKLLTAGAKVDVTTKNGNTALMVASRFGCSDAVHALLKRGKNINAANSKGWTALHFAAVEGKFEVIKKLLTAGAYVDVTTKNGDTALMVASEFLHSDAVDALLERDKNIDAANSKGWTALHYAAKAGKEVVRVDVRVHCVLTSIMSEKCRPSNKTWSIMLMLTNRLLILNLHVLGLTGLHPITRFCISPKCRAHVCHHNSGKWCVHPKTYAPSSLSSIPPAVL
ncbi:serine/threonine-protein phosphatase 6 regulatory ankyrin repeat subunit B-like [Wyeomyia smithii]|uniref:serine/threonine-protein phosphatase 6 regulatory ankyrin repeat subunit B-like n=1 Tax=Wyeomyia smithii TaxID=174621 RepID=UPI002467B9EC|nr:serine/threonine-protein phosphatase 6 regulatory ankyrin repeat subunit B-like [Wyeomyia smithii]